jgi:putative FmdB family regulatory protein
MPIYAYRCATCGHAQDVLQRMSDPLLTVCPACGAATYEKQVTAAGFQLKGSGWYVTDFRNGNTGAAAKKDGEGKDAAADSADAAGKTDKAEAGDKPAAAPAAAGDPANATTSAKASAAPAPAATKPAAAPAAAPPTAAPPAAGR